MSDDTHISVPANGNVNEPGDADARLPMTPSQASYLKQLSSETGVPVNLNMNRHDAAKKISALEAKRGQAVPGDG